MKIAIKNPAPLGPELHRWGDYHFGASLQRALERRGVEVVQHYWPDWDIEDDAHVDLVLRGKRRYRPSPDRPALIWIISHPADVDPDELDGYALVYTASWLHKILLESATKTPVEMMRQCTDTSLFYPPGRYVQEELRSRRDVVFVANSRGTRRDMALWAAEAGVKPKLFGRHWQKCDMDNLVEKEYIPNEQLPHLYRESRLGLNDHWVDMKHFGIINNRVMDCVACGLPVLSDGFPELRDVFDDGILYANNTAEFREAIDAYQDRYEELLERTRERWGKMKDTHSFDARAEQIAAQALSPPDTACRRTISVGAYDLRRMEKSFRQSAIQQIQRIGDIEDVANKALKREARTQEAALRREARAQARVQEAARQTARVRSELSQVASYTSKLEKRYQKIVGSRVWRILKWLRALWAIGCRVLTGRSVPARQPLNRPAVLSEYELSRRKHQNEEIGKQVE